MRHPDDVPGDPPVVPVPLDADPDPDPESPPPAEPKVPSVRKKEVEERIDDALDMTFPASDPPAWPAPKRRSE